MNGNSAVEAFARLGYAAKGVVYMLIGALAVSAALGSGAAGDSGRAIRAVNEQPFGKVMLAVIGIGLVAYALWRWYSGIANPEDKKPATRMGYIGTGIVNFGVATEALRIAFSNGSADASNQAPHWTAEVMSQPFGVWLVAAVGVGIAAYGTSQIVRAFRSKLDKQLRLGELEASTRRLVRRVSRIGITARGAVFVVMGFFLAKAALEEDPGQARDLGAALRAVHEQPYGQWLLGGVAVGLFLYGIYNLVRARYRAIHA